VVSLDAAKAFDKLWRDGLFYKLIPRTDASVWRPLYQYYGESSAIMNVEGYRSTPFKINEGVKQGGILSSFLFNFFLDDLLNSLMSMEIGGLLNGVNTSALAYCDGILLLASNEGHMQRLVDCCAKYAEKWKLSFNPLKSSCYSIKATKHDFILNGDCVPRTEGFVYLGLPVGTEEFVEAFYSNKMTKCERALYSLKNIGCNPHKLHPRAIGFIYKQYCQSILKFGFEFVFLRKSFLRKLEIRQNILLKNILGIHHRARFKIVLNTIKVEQVYQLYEKHKLFGWRQCLKNYLTERILNGLSVCTSNINCTNKSFFQQLKEVVGSKELQLANLHEIKNQISEKYTCCDQELKEQVEGTLDRFHRMNSYQCIYELNNILRVNTVNTISNEEQ
jgi:hypothetical protein